MPLTNYAFADLITFTRSTTATFVGSNGLIQSAAINAPRFDFSPVTLAPLGFLIEEQRVNLALYSEQFDNAVYIKVRSSITANATTSPDGTATADKLVEDTTATSTHLIQLQGGFSSFVSGTTYVISGYAKVGERTSASISMGTDAGVFAGQSANFDFSTGAISAQSGVATFAMTNAGNGWYRWSIAATAAASGAGAIRFSLIGPLGSTTYTGNGTSGLFLWGNQIEAGAFPTSYIPTVASTVTRAADVASITGADFSPWYNQSEGTIIAQFVALTTGVNSTGGNSFLYVYDIDSAAAPTSSHVLVLSAAYGPGWDTNTSILGVLQSDINAAMSLGNTSVRKIAYAYRTNDFAASANGGAALTDTSGNLPTNNRMSIGSQNVGGSLFTGYMQRITYYPTRLTDAQLQALTS
jgi:hypothetical protein